MVDKAAPHLAQALAIRRQLFGDEHLDVAESLRDHALVLHDRGEFTGAMEMLEAGKRILVAAKGPEGSELANLLQVQSDLQRHLGNYESAEQLGRDAVSMSRKLRGDGHPEVSDTMSAHSHVVFFLGILLQQQGKLAEAEGVFRHGLELGRRQLPKGDPGIAGMLARLGFLQLQSRNHAGAELTLRECQSIRSEKELDEWTTYNTMSLLGAALAGQGKHEEADLLLREGYEKMRPPAGDMSRKREALQRLIEHYETWGRPEEAAKWRRLLGDEPKASGR
jgi:tetratricopeptide (TPR) repeat protein